MGVSVIGIREETAFKHPFNSEASWTRPEWYGDKLMSVESEVADVLYSFVRAVKPETVLETGTHKGFSTVALATALSLNGSGKLDTIDVKDYNMIPYTLKKKGAEKHKVSGEDIVDKHVGDVFEVMKRMIDEERKFNIIFCDDNHEGEHLKKELTYFDRLITKPGYIIFHDSFYDAKGDVGEIIGQWAYKHNYPRIQLYTSRGLDIVHVKRETDTKEN